MCQLMVPPLLLGGLLWLSGRQRGLRLLPVLRRWVVLLFSVDPNPWVGNHGVTGVSSGC